VREARRTPQRQPVSFMDALAQLFAELRLPRPAVALAATLIVGIVAGWATPFEAAEDDVAAVHVESFLYPEEEA
jgi:TRAP-type C4-dicarboxylate transport system permease large subunit